MGRAMGGAHDCSLSYMPKCLSPAEQNSYLHCVENRVQFPFFNMTRVWCCVKRSKLFLAFVCNMPCLFFSICTCKIQFNFFSLLLFEISDWSMGHSCTISHQMRKQFNQERSVPFHISKLFDFFPSPSKQNTSCFVLPSIAGTRMTFWR